jgi:hypothetical protein
MSEVEKQKISGECVTPVLYVKDFLSDKKDYTEKLLFEVLWEWDKPPTFGCVRLEFSGQGAMPTVLPGQATPRTRIQPQECYAWHPAFSILKLIDQ